MMLFMVRQVGILRWWDIGDLLVMLVDQLFIQCCLYFSVVLWEWGQHLIKGFRLMSICYISCWIFCWIFTLEISIVQIIYYYKFGKFVLVYMSVMNPIILSYLKSLKFGFFKHYA